MMRDHVRLQVRRLACEPANHLFRRAAAVDFLLEIGERLDEEERADDGKKEIVQSHRLVHVQGLQERFVEDEDQAGRHRSMIVRYESWAYNRHKTHDRHNTGTQWRSPSCQRNSGQCSRSNGGGPLSC